VIGSLVYRGVLSFIAGIVSAAVLQRIFGFFFVVIWLATIVTALFFMILSKGVLSKIVEVEVRKVVRMSILIAVMAVQMFFLATIPLTIDRSFSVWLLARSDLSETKYVSLAKLENDTQIFFLANGSELKKRMNEQVSLGNLVWNSNNSGVSLSKRGQVQVLINRWVANFFGLSPKYATGGS
jgi:hypothetical protein